MKSKKKEYIRKNYFDLEKDDIKIIEFFTKKVFSSLKTNFKKKEFQENFLITGGYLRDRILFKNKKKIMDYDFISPETIFDKIYIIIQNLSKEEKLQIKDLKMFPVKNINTYLIRFYLEDLEIQIKKLTTDKKEDIKKRDFTMNCLYYNLFTDKIIDYCKGMEDIKNNYIKTIIKIDTVFKNSFPRFFRLARSLVYFKADNNIITFTINFFKNKDYLNIRNYKKVVKNQMMKIVYYDNTARIVKIMMNLSIFDVFYDEKDFSFENKKLKKKFYFSIVNLINKIDVLLTNKKYLKKKFDLSEENFKKNIYSLKTNAIIYCFYHPNFFKGNLKEKISQTTKSFNFTRVYTPYEFFKLGYDLEKQFSLQSFNVFEDKIKNKTKTKYKPICKLLTFLPLLKQIELKLINSKGFLKKLDKIELRNFDEKNVENREEKIIIKENIFDDLHRLEMEKNRDLQNKLEEDKEFFRLHRLEMEKNRKF